jgi:diacylglycerol kinase family enzyme
VAVAANPKSGLGLGRRRVESLVSELDALGLDADVSWTLPDRDELLRRAVDVGGCRAVVAVGGDGTIADLINLNVNAAPDVPLTVLPAGTENLFARHFGLGRDPSRLARAIVARRTRTIDLGLAGSRRFSLMAGFGFDADVVTRHHRRRVSAAGAMRTTHRAAYVGPVLRSSWAYRFPRLTLHVEDPERGPETLVGTSAFVFNLPRYALGLPFAPRACGEDGWLDLVVFRDPGALRALHYLWLVFRRLHLTRADVIHRRTRRVRIEAAGTVPAQLDGDPGGFVTPEDAWDVSILPRALSVLVPASHRPAAANSTQLQPTGVPSGEDR